jgi:hypothetical protein
VHATTKKKKKKIEKNLFFIVYNGLSRFVLMAARSSRNTDTRDEGV